MASVPVPGVIFIASPNTCECSRILVADYSRRGRSARLACLPERMHISVFAARERGGGNHPTHSKRDPFGHLGFESPIEAGRNSSLNVRLGSTSVTRWRSQRVPHLPALIADLLFGNQSINQHAQL